MNRKGPALPVAFCLLKSEFNDFLFASIDDDGDRHPLSVLSALTRAGVDPWQHAARLNRLPRDAAIETLASIIAALPERPSAAAEARESAGRLIALLPPQPSAKARLGGAMRRVCNAFTLLIHR